MNAQTEEKKVFKLLNDFFETLDKSEEIPEFRIYEIKEWLSAEEFRKLTLEIVENGFVIANSSVNRIAHYLGYSEYKIIEEYTHLINDEITIFLEYYVVRHKDEIEYEILFLGFGKE